MTIAEKHIKHYNELDGREIDKASLKEFYVNLKRDLEEKRIDVRSHHFKHLLIVQKKIFKAVSRMDDDKRIVVVDKPIKLQKIKKITSSPIDESMLYGLEEISNDKDLDGKSLDGLNDTTYQVITDRILELLKQGGLIWRKPWNTKVNGPSDLAHNHVTKNIYRAGNYYLNFLSEALGGLTVLIKGKKRTITYKHSQYFTFKQVSDLGGKVNKDEMGWPVVYFKWLYRDQKKNKLVPEAEARDANRKLKPGYIKFPGLFYYNVFNYDQCSDLKIKFEKSKARTEKEKIETAEKMVREMPKKPPIKKGFEDAFYSPTEDFIEMPSMSQFKVGQQYYSVLFHEMIHSTGHKKRVGRDLSGRFGSKNYAFEELIAELGSSFLCGESGVLYYTLKNSAAYIKNWSSRLAEEMKADPKFFLRAASQAQKAADFILGREGSEENKVPTPKEATKVASRANKIAQEANTKDRAPVKRKKPAVKVQPVANTKSVEKQKASPSNPLPEELRGLGFITSDKTPENSRDTFTLPGPIGSVLGELQRYRLTIVIAGETHSGKSELGKQIADAFMSIGYEVPWLDWEQGGLTSKDTRKSIDRNISPQNKSKFHVSADVPPTIEALKELAKYFKVIGIDSATKLKFKNNDWMDELRTECPDTVWILLFQQTVDGGTRGGSAAEFDSPVVVKTYRPDKNDYKKNYAHVIKNRGNKTGQYFLIAEKQEFNPEEVG